MQAAATASLLPALGCGGNGGRPTSFLLLVSDDQDRRDLHFAGNPHCTTPHLDRLASEGQQLTAAYTPISICQPSRSVIYTGRWPHRSGAVGFGPIHKDTSTWPELFRGSEVSTAMIGKLHVEPTHRFEFDFKVLSGPQEHHGRNPQHFGAKFGEFLGGLGGGAFNAVINFRDPHRPFPTPGVSSGKAAQVENPHDPTRALVHPFLHDTPETRRELAAYYDAIRRMDEGCGEILAALARAGYAEDTLVVFTSDNGMPFPFAKTTLYESGIHMPMIARWPGVIEPGSENDAFVSFLDLLPTALDLANLDAPAELDGASLLPLLRGEVDSIRDAVFAQHTEHLVGDKTPSRSIRVGNWKYIRNTRPLARFQNNAMESETWRSWRRLAPTDPGLAQRMRGLEFRAEEELFDLDADPCELNNLASSDEHRGTLESLRTRLHRWLVEEEDPLLAEWPG